MLANELSISSLEVNLGIKFPVLHVQSMNEYAVLTAWIQSTWSLIPGLISSEEMLKHKCLNTANYINV